MTRRSALAAAIAATALALPLGTAHALTAGPANFNVTVTIANFCTISAGNVTFGSVNAGAAATNTASSVTLTCNKGAQVTSVVLNNGTNPSVTQKRMKDPVSGDFLNYFIDRPTGATFNTCPAVGTAEWNATGIVATPLFAVTGGAKLITLCASIPAGQFPSAGAYSDTVAVTATYN
jgi:spore coat protein U-like protein